MLSCKANKSVNEWHFEGTSFHFSKSLNGKKEIQRLKGIWFVGIAKNRDNLLIEYYEDSIFYQFDVYSVKYDVCLAYGYGRFNKRSSIPINPNDIVELEYWLNNRRGSFDVYSFNYNSKIIEQVTVNDSNWATVKYFNKDNNKLSKMRIFNDYPCGSIDSTYYFNDQGNCNKMIISHPGRLQTILFFD